LKRKKKHIFKVFENVSIERAGGEGKAIAHIEGKVVFVAGAAPGDVAHIKITQEKRRFFEGVIQELIVASPIRQTPFCSHFGVCGGCKWQHIQYSEQLKLKNEWAKDCLQRIGKLEVQEYFPPLGATELTEYRNKLDFTATAKAWEDNFDKENPQAVKGIGFHVPGRWDKILDVQHCHLMAEPSNKIRNRLKEIVIDLGCSFWNPVENTGFMRNIMVRNSTLGDFLVILSFFEEDQEKINLIFSALIKDFPEVNSWMYVINSKVNDSWSDLNPVLYQGKGYLEEKMEDLVFKIRPLSFFQTNIVQATRLYQLVRDWANLQGNELVYDLYTGTGSIAQFVAKKAAKVIGIEYVQSAIDDAKENAQANNLGNTEFFAGDMKDLLTAEFIAKHGTPDLIITDPPREGMHKDVVERILEAAPARIIYVSCNPATQARDLQLMSHAYNIERSCAADLFPHTHHVENITLLTLKEGK